MGICPLLTPRDDGLVVSRLESLFHVIMVRDSLIYNALVFWFVKLRIQKDFHVLLRTDKSWLRTTHIIYWIEII